MRKFKYVGPHDGVELPDLGIEVAQGETVEVDGEVADDFDARDDWEHIPDPARSKAAKKAAATREANAESEEQA